MSWTLLVTFVAVLGAIVFGLAGRRREITRMSSAAREREQARERGSHAARLQYPHVDLSACLGCGTCIRACPEEGVLELIHGQASVVHGARCVGHGKCAAECPTGAITVTLGDLSNRKDIPVLTESFEAAHVPGLFLAGEVTGYALIRTAISHGTAIADEVSRRLQSMNGSKPDVATAFDLCIVGAGPAGIACSLQAKAKGLSFAILEQEELGGTVAKYPRRKLVMTQPADLPLYGRLSRTSYQKEELMDIWTAIVQEHELPLHTGIRFTGVTQRADGVLAVQTDSGEVLAHNVCLALGRRGSPRKLGVPGEDLGKVAYSLIDAQSYQGRRVLVVGGGDSAIEAALGLAAQPGNEVTLSYRKHAFFRLKARNENALSAALETNGLQVLYESQVAQIGCEHVELDVKRNGGTQREYLPNDDVFVFAGGIPPFKVLEDSGISFDPHDHAQDEQPLTLQGTGLFRALQVALVVAACALTWALAFAQYYALPMEARPDSSLHDLLRPSGKIGLPFGIAAAALILVNLAYLLRRNRIFGFEWGALRGWMASHVATGLLALDFAFLHGAMDPRHTVGGHAFLGLVVLVITGAIGRYFYAFVPHAANGRELELEELQQRLAGLSSEWDRSGGRFTTEIRVEVDTLVAAQHWKGSFPRRVWALVTSHRQLRKALRRLRSLAAEEGLSSSQLEPLLALARRAQRAGFMAAHYEHLRGLLSTWRYVHRWTALLMVLLVVVHVVTALRFWSAA